MYRCTIRVSDRAGGTLEFGLKGAVGIKGSLAFFLRSGVPSGWHPPSMRMPRTALRVLHARSSLQMLNYRQFIWTALCGNGTVPARLSQSTLRARNWALPSPALHRQTVDAAETLSVAAVL